VVVLTCGSYGDMIRLLPPLVIELALLDDGLETVSRAVDDLLASLASTGLDPPSASEP
jgi:4-aminobutyrate aminotransferase/(S)-3-amino-2-methylpropionate transaminase